MANKKIKVDLDLENNKILNLAEPILPSDAVNLSYFQQNMKGFNFAAPQTFSNTGAGVAPAISKDFVIWEGNSSFDIRGFFTELIDGDAFVLYNNSNTSAVLNLLHESSFAAATSRIKCPGNLDLALNFGESVFIIYRNTGSAASRYWVIAK